MEIPVEIKELNEASFQEEVSLVITENDELRSLNRLRKKYSVDGARFLLQQARLRQKAVKKIPLEIAEKLYCEKIALEQASSWLVSEYRAKKIHELFPDVKRVWDLGCGIGIDTINFAKYFDVNAVELDNDRHEIFKHNIAKLLLNSKVQCLNADFTKELSAIKSDDFVFIDPARRDASGKKASVLDYIPSLEFVNEVLKYTQKVAVKISPAVDLKELTEIDFDAAYQLEFISENSDLKECILWFGNVTTETFNKYDVEKIATLLPENLSLVSSQVGYDSPDIFEEILDSPQYIYEPDFAIIRSGLIDYLIESIGVRKIDSQIAYLGSIEFKPEVLKYSRNRIAYKVIKILDYNLKSLSNQLALLNVYFVDVKKRGIELDLDKVQTDLNKDLQKKQAKISPQFEVKDAIVFFTKINNRSKVIVCKKISA